RLASIASAKRRDRVRIVAIDPGHGGDDTGAKGPRGLLEKRVTLAVARALADELNKIPGIRAALTRDRDYFVPLRERYRLAETLLDHIAAGRRLEERGVKQAGFAVLKSVEFPSVLVETAFINNPVEARLLASSEFQQQLGRQLAAGVRTYFQKAGVTLGDSVGGPPDPRGAQ